MRRRKLKRQQRISKRAIIDNLKMAVSFSNKIWFKGARPYLLCQCIFARKHRSHALCLEKKCRRAVGSLVLNTFKVVILLPFVMQLHLLAVFFPCDHRSGVAFGRPATENSLVTQCHVDILRVNTKIFLQV